MKFLQLTIIAILLLLSTSLFAQKEDETKKKTSKKSTFKVDIDYRTRLDNQPSPASIQNLAIENTPEAYLLGHRARLILGYDSKKVQVKFSFQDIRNYGANKASGKIWGSNNGNGLAIHEAWTRLMFINTNNKQVGLKIGRQEVVFNKRLISNKNWSFAGAAYDAITLGCSKTNGTEWDLGMAYNSVDLIGAANPFRILGYFHFAKKIGNIVTIHILDLHETFEQDTEFKNAKQDSTYFRNTVGFYPEVKFKGLAFHGNVFYQMGKAKDLKGENSAFLTVLDLSYKYKISNKKSIKLLVGFDNYSGRAYNDTLDKDINKAFTAPYASSHAYFGFTNFQKNMFKTGQGAKDIYAKLITEYDKTSVCVGAHMISYSKLSAYTNDKGENVEFLNVGNNFDVMIKHKLGKKMKVMAAYSLMMPTDDYVHQMFNSNGYAYDTKVKMHNYFWVMFSFQPNLFTHIK